MSSWGGEGEEGDEVVDESGNWATVLVDRGKRVDVQYKNSGRIGTMVIGTLNLDNVPFGTLFWIAALYFLSQPEVEQLYTK